MDNKTSKADYILMRRIVLYTIFIVGISLNLFAQTIPQFTVRQNLEDFNYALDELEKSYAGFETYVNETTRQQYDSIVARLRKQIETENRLGYDAALFLYSCFDDAHLGIDLGSLSLSEQYMSERKKFNPYETIQPYMPEPVALKVTDKTFLVRLPEFVEEIVSFNWVENAIHEFNSSGSENLILDIRGNGGGDERLWHPFLPLIFSHTGAVKNIEFRMSDNNIKYLKLMALQFPEAQMLLDRYNETNASYVPLTDSEDIIIDIPDYDGIKPRRVAIIIDANNASAAEFLLLQAKAVSDKTQLYGKENTRGCFDCSNVRKTTFLPNSKCPLSIPISRTCKLADFGIDKTGIAPDVIVPIDYPRSLTNNIDEWTLWIANELEK